MTVPAETSEGQDDSYKVLDEVVSLPDANIPGRPEIRNKTDRAFLIVFGVAIVLLLPFLIYTVCYSDVNRLQGYDNCGNVCGQKNIKDSRWECTGQDMTSKPAFVFSSGKCEKGEDEDSLFYTEKNFSKFIHIAIWKFALVSLLPLALCLMLIALFRYFPTMAVWSILVLSWLPVMTVILYVLLMLTAPIWPLPIFCIIVVLLISWALFNPNKIRSATVLLKVATRAVFKVNKISYVSIAALCLSLVIFLIYTTITFRTMTAGKLTQQSPNALSYTSDGWMIATQVFNAIIAVWVITFIFGVQDMILSGVVNRWYTTRNQYNIFNTVPVSFAITLNYHLGTVALGCLLTGLMSIPRTFLSFLAQFSALKEKSTSWLTSIDGYFTNNAYIITAIEGTSYIQSGKKATKLLRESIGNTVELNYFANSIILIAQGLVVFISTLGGYLMLNFGVGPHYPYTQYFTLVEAGIAYICGHSILGTLKVSANTLFFCTSEELVRNKEANLPYTMPLSELMDGSNKLFLQKVQNKPFSNVVEKTLCIKVFLAIFILVGCVVFVFCFV